MTCSQNWDFVMEVGSKDESGWCGMMASAADKIGTIYQLRNRR